MIGWLLSLLAAATIVAAWWTPGSVECAALGWSSVALFVASLQAPNRRIMRAFVAGAITYAGGFYWLYGTIKDFGGFPTVAAIAIFALFVFGSAVQFIIWGFVWQRLPHFIIRLGLRSDVAWLIAHHFWIKIFPWDFGHTQIAFLPLAQIADITGVTGITFLMMWLAEALVARRSVGALPRITACATFIAAIMYGVYAQDVIERLAGTPLKTFLIQGNVSLHKKHNMQYFTVNREQYLKISARVAEKDSLIIWPESTITEFIPANLENAYSSAVLPFLNNGSAFLIGGLTYRSKAEYFNSSILIRPDGTLDTPYNKMILMPFGEYTPLSSLLPWLQDINSTAGQFTPGSNPSVLSFTLSNGSQIKLSPLICYEDILPSIARDATVLGAQLLINQTNDAWFGDSVAPYQHHMIAAFRAIENRRFLLRSTNTGVTAVVDPLGRTLASLLPFTEGVLPMEIQLLSYSTIFTTYPIYLVWWGLAVLFVLLALRPQKRSQQIHL